MLYDKLETDDQSPIRLLFKTSADQGSLLMTGSDG